MGESTLEKKALETIASHDMLSRGDKVVVGVSGGPDSVALLMFLKGIADRFELDLNVFHLDHMFRGKESVEDARYVEELARDIGLPARVESIDVPSLVAEGGPSPQDAARRVRRERLMSYAEEIGARRIALGHTADDQVETFLMRVIQGAGLTGLGGISAVSGKFIRPLIGVWRAEVEEYCALMKVTPRIDSSNIKDIYMRNRVRNHLVPNLTREFGAGVKETILREVESLSHDRELIGLQVSEAIERVAMVGEDNVRVEIRPLLDTPPSIQRGIVRQAWTWLRPDEANLGWRHVADIFEKVVGGRTGARLDLPRSVVVEREYDHLVFRERRGEEPLVRLSLTVPGRVSVPASDLILEASEVTALEVVFSDDPRVEYVRPDLERPFEVRNQLPGDRFQPLGGPGTRKLKDFFIDMKLPRRERSRCPIVLSGGQVVWVAGHRLDERFRLREGDRSAIRLRIFPGGE